MADETKIVGLKVGVDTGDSVNQVKRLEDASNGLFSGLTNLSGGTGVAAAALGALAAGLAALQLGEYIKDATMLAARVETLGVVMHAVGVNAGYTSREMDAFAKSIAAQGITTEASRQAAIRLAQAHVDLTKSSTLARIAQDAAVIANTNSSDAFDRMTTGISTGQAIILHHMGLMVNFEHAYKELGVTLGKSSDELTEQEKTQARVNEVMKAGAGIAGSYESAMTTAGKQITSLSRYFEEIKLAVGEPFTETFSLVLQDVNHSLKGLLGTMKDNKGPMTEFGHDVADAYRFLKNECNQLASALDMLGGEATRVAAIGMKSAELLTRFVTIGQFGDGLNSRYEGLRQINKIYEERFKLHQNEIAAYNAASGVSGPTLDPKEAMLLRMAKESAELKKIAGRKNETSPTKDPGETDVTEQLWNHYLSGLKGFNDQIRQLNPDLTEFQKKSKAIDDTLEKQLETFAKYKDDPGVKKYIESLKAAAAGAKQNLSIDYALKGEGRDLTPREEYQFDQTAMLSKWAAAREDYNRKEEQAEFDHQNVLAGLHEGLLERKLSRQGKEEDALNAHYAFEQQQALAQLNWTLEHTALEEEQKARLRENYNQQQIVREEQKAQALADLWQRNSQTYLNFAQSMTTMGLQYLLFDEGQRDQIGKRMLASSVRFLGQGLQQFMFTKAKEHLFNAAAAAGRTTTDMAAATANLGILETQSVAWAAFFTAMSLNPFGGQMFIPAATAMTAVAGGVVPSAMATVAATGATSVSAEIGMAAAWAAGGMLAGGLGEAGASAIEGGTSGSTTPAGYGAGTPSSPVVTQPSANSSKPQVNIIVRIDGNVISDDKWVETTLAPTIRDLAQNRNVNFGLVPA